MTQRRGFSLPEVLVGMALASLVLVMGLVQTRHSTNTAETRGMAEEIAEELRAARRLAIAGKAPVALAFASGGGTAGHGRGVYILQGQDRPKIIKGRDFSGDYPRACAFLGYWPVSGFANSRTPLPLVGNDTNFQPSAWPVPHPKDFLFIFTPSGHLTTNGLAHFDGAYHILVSQGISYSGAGAPPGTVASLLSYFSPTEVASPYTVAVTSGGAITVTAGVTASSLSSTTGTITTPKPPAIPQATSVNADPVLVKSTADPVSPDLPEGVSATVPVEGYLTLRLEVREPDGQTPRMRWTGSGGTFSSDKPTLMEWDQRRQLWFGEWTWTPPERATEGRQFTLRYTVEDGEGGRLTGVLGANGKVEVGSTERISYCESTESGGSRIQTVTPEGYGKRSMAVNDALHQYLPAWAPGGNQLAFYEISKGEATSLCVVNQDGSGFRRLRTFAADAAFPGFGRPAWSADGTRLAFSEYRGNTGGIYTISSSGANLRQITASAPNVHDSDPQWSPDGNWIVFVRAKTDYSRDPEEGDVTFSEITRVRSLGGSVQVLAEDTVAFPNEDTEESSEDNYWPKYTPDGSQIIYARDGELRKMRPDGSQKRLILEESIFGFQLEVSPDGQYLCYRVFEGVDFGPVFDIRNIPTLITALQVTTVTGLHPDTLAKGSKTIATSRGIEGVFEIAGFSPNSKKLAFNGDGKLSVANVRGRIDIQQIVEDKVLLGYCWPSWTK